MLENRGRDHGRLPACELAVPDAPRDVARGGEQVASPSATQAGGSGDVKSSLLHLAIDRWG
jgi:hypothetical protein